MGKTFNCTHMGDYKECLNGLVNRATCNDPLGEHCPEYKPAKEMKKRLSKHDQAQLYFMEKESQVRKEYGERYKECAKVAFIQRPTFGFTERGVVLRFVLTLEEGGSAVHWAFYPEYEHWLVRYKAEKVSNIHLKPIWIIDEGNGKRMFPIRPIIIE